MQLVLDEPGGALFISRQEPRLLMKASTGPVQERTLLQYERPHEQVGGGERGAQLAHPGARALRGGPGQTPRGARAPREPGQRAKTGRHVQRLRRRGALRPLRRRALGLHRHSMAWLPCAALDLGCRVWRTYVQLQPEQ